MALIPIVCLPGKTLLKQLLFECIDAAPPKKVPANMGDAPLLLKSANEKRGRNVK
jgi:hypothetical protein